MATLFITHPLGQKDRVIYDAHATTTDYCRVTFEDSEGNPAEWTGPAVEITLDGGDTLEVYQSVDGQSPLGRYVVDASSWKLFGPDGPPRVLSDAGPIEIDGVSYNPKQFQPVTPGRWLVKVQGQLIVQETDTGLGYYVASDKISTFTALIEIEDPHVIGNVDGGHLETSSGSIGTSFAAPTEETEYDSDEGWSRSVERYLSTVSKGMSFRKLATGFVTDAGGIQYGELLTFVETEEYSRWRSSLVGIDLAGTERYYYNYSLRVRKVTAVDLQNSELLAEMPIFVSLGTADQNGRVYMMVEGCLPYDTTAAGLAGEALPTIDPATGRNTRLFIQPTGVVGKSRPSVADPLYFDRYVGHVVLGNTADDTALAGSIYFHGHASWLPGTVQGPLESTDDAVVRWDGTTGEKIQNSALAAQHMQDAETLIPTSWMNISSPPSVLTESYDDIKTMLVMALDKSSVIDPEGTALYLTTETRRSPGNVALRPGTTTAGGDPGELYLLGGVGDATGGNVYIQSGPAAAEPAGATSGALYLTTHAGLSVGSVVLQAGNAFGTDPATESAGDIRVEASNAAHIDAGSVSIEAGSTEDLSGLGSLGGDVRIDGGVGASGGDVVINGGSPISVADQHGDVIISYHTDGSLPKGRTGIGGPAPNSGFAAMPTAVLKVTGDSYFEGDLHISNKLTVDGIIDPIALILTSHVDDLAGAIPAGEGALFVAKGDGSTDHEGNPLVAGELYYKYESGYDGIAEKVVSISAGAGLVIPGPAVGTTYANAIAKWATDNGAELDNSKVLVDDATSHALGAFFNDIASLSTATPLGSTKTDDGLSWTTSTPLLITTGTAAVGSGNAAGDIEISPGMSDAPTPANVSIKSGETRVGGAVGGRIDISGGDVGAVTSDFFSSGGPVFLRGGNNNSGTTPGPNDWERRASGGSTIVGGGDGNDGGNVQIKGGSSIDANTSLYAHGKGGSVTVSGGQAGLDPTGTKASYEPGTTDIAVRGGDLILSAGTTAMAPGNQTIKGPSGGDVYISGGNAGIGTGAPVNGTVAAPTHTVQEASAGAFATESQIQPLNAGNHQFHGRGGSVVIEAGAGDHTGGSGSVLIRTQHSNQGWSAGGEVVAGIDPNAGRGSIGDIRIEAADSISRAGTNVPGGNIVLQAGKAGYTTAGDGGRFQLRPGEPDWPLSAPIDHDGDPATPDITLIEAGPDAQTLVLGAVTPNPWPVDFAAAPGPTLIGPTPGSVSLDPEGRGVVLVGTDTFDPTNHLVFGATMPTMVVDGDLQVTGNIDPKGLELRPEANNPARTAIIAKGGDPDDPIHADRVANVLWVNSSSGNALMHGDNPINAVGAVIENPAEAVAGAVPILNSDGSVRAISSTELGGYYTVVNYGNEVIGTETRGATYVSFSEYTGAGENIVNRDNSVYPNSRDYIMSVGPDVSIVLVDLTQTLVSEAAQLDGWLDENGNFDVDGDHSDLSDASLSRYVVELPPVAESSGRKIVVKDAKGYSNKFAKFPMIVVRASTNGSVAEYVDDAPSFGVSSSESDAALLPEPYASVTLLCNGERWLII